MRRLYFGYKSHEISILGTLVNIQKTIENGHTNSGFTQLENGDFPVRYVNVYQRVVGYFLQTCRDNLLLLLLEMDGNGIYNTNYCFQCIQDWTF